METKERDFIVNFGPVVLEPGETRRMSATVEIFEFVGEKIVAGEAIPMSTAIAGLFVKGEPQMPVGKTIPSAFFTAETKSGSLELSPCGEGDEIAIEVKNNADIPVKWEGALLGRGKSKSKGEVVAVS